MKNFLLLPEPRHILFSNGILTLSADRLIVLDNADPQALRFTAARLQQALRDCAGLTWEVVASIAAPHEQAGITLSMVPDGVRHPQGYELTITEEGIHVVASAHAGIFYAVMTLIQILEQCIRDLPTLRIRDRPDFSNRGVMLDISRDKVPTMETLFDLVDLLASWKANQVQLYMEHTFAYRNHPEVWAEASPLTGEEVLALDAYCRERFVELVPYQNSFSHMRRWLVHDRYRHLAECPEGCETRWGYFDEPLSLCPLDPGSLNLLRTIFDELLPHFSSRYFNVGCDETVDLGLGRSKEAVEKYGEGRVCLDFLLKIYREVKARGRTMQFWGDIIMKHPDLVGELPRDLITQATMRLAGLPAHFSAALATFPTIEGAAQVVFEIMRQGLSPAALGLLTTEVVALLNRDSGLGLREEPTLFMEFHGASELALGEELGPAQELCQEAGAASFQAGLGIAERNRLWEARYQTFESIKRAHPGLAPFIADVAVPISHYPEIIEYAGKVVRDYGVVGYIFGHAGDGNLHLVFMGDPQDKEGWGKIEKANQAIVTRGLGLEGTATGEHGVGIGKRCFMEREHGKSLELMRQIKALLDPKGILNLGKIFP